MNCPLCDSDYLQHVTSELRNGPGKVVRCADCDLAMLKDGAKVDYPSEYRATHGPVIGERSTPEQLFEAYRPHQEHRLAILGELLTDETRLLEIGCSAGQFLDAVKDRVKVAAGVEPDPQAGEYAAHKTGCSVYRGQGEMPKGRYDVICLFQVVEHLSDPLEELAALADFFLTDDGVFCIEVPSTTDPLLTIYKNEAYARFYYHEAHAFYFAPKSLRLMMEKLGFTGDIYGVQDYTFLNHLHWAYAGKPMATSAEGLDCKWPAGPLPEFGNLLDLLAGEMDGRYKYALAQAGCTENITFLGRRKDVS